MLLDYHSFYGSGTPPPPTVSTVYDWYQRRRRKPMVRPRRPEPEHVPPVPVPSVSIGMDVTLPGVVQYASGRVRVRMVSHAALRLAVSGRALVRAIALADVATMPPDMQAALSVAYSAALVLPVPQPVSEGRAELKVLLQHAAAIPNPDAAARGAARITALARADMLRPALLAVMRVDEQQDIDDAALLALAEELLDDDEDWD